MALQTVTALQEAGNQVTVVLPNEGPLSERMREIATRVIVLPVAVTRKEYLSPVGLVKLALWSVSSMVSAIKLIRKVQPEIVFVNTLTQPVWILAAKALRLRTICHVREIESGSSKVVQAALVLPLIFVDTVICNSESTRKFVLTSSPFRIRHSQVIYNGKNWEPYFRSEPIRQSSDHIRILVIGRISPRKGQDVVLRAASKVASGGVSLSITFAGDIFPGYEWFKEELLSLQTELSGDIDYKYVGFVNDIAEVLENCDLVIVPSRQEPFGTVAAEAMAAMRTTIVSNVEGLVEIVTNEETGFVFQSEDSDALCTIINKLIRDDELSRSVAHRGFRHVRDTFSEEMYNSRILNVIEEI
ncbi:glycosyltransferase family 4 protein [Rhodococcus sp. IEGM 1366]|uniref:glycosyltransferase family 4 protein n=1 Tax=Rhodococcus sp. IEGM 1366 TaxID=3082223 RepID=UPI0029531134|nr:glycosyltransferase family 4 protein [Rhodococcus sp. IEGM 1366]MDV8069614.1 glycosyltransferase family 4 protein [Rhodococcus sp. IEGM 1366]